EQRVDLLRRLDVGARVVVERHLEAVLPRERRRVLDVGGVAVPLLRVEPEPGATPGVRPPLRRAGAREGRLGREVGAHRGGLGEEREGVAVAGQRRGEGGVVDEGQVDPAPGEREPVPAQVVPQLLPAAEHADRPGVDPGVPGGRDEPEELVRLGDPAAGARAELEDAVAHGGVGQGDHSSPSVDVAGAAGGAAYGAGASVGTAAAAGLVRTGAGARRVRISPARRASPGAIPSSAPRRSVTDHSAPSGASRTTGCGCRLALTTRASSRSWPTRRRLDRTAGPVRAGPATGAGSGPPAAARPRRTSGSWRKVSPHRA